MRNIPGSISHPSFSFDVHIAYVFFVLVYMFGEIECKFIEAFFEVNDMNK